MTTHKMSRLFKWTFSWWVCLIEWCNVVCINGYRFLSSRAFQWYVSWTKLIKSNGFAKKVTFDKKTVTFENLRNGSWSVHMNYIPMIRWTSSIWSSVFRRGRWQVRRSPKATFDKKTVTFEYLRNGTWSVHVNYIPVIRWMSSIRWTNVRRDRCPKFMYDVHQ